MLTLRTLPPIPDSIKAPRAAIDQAGHLNGQAESLNVERALLAQRKKQLLTADPRGMDPNAVGDEIDQLRRAWIDSAAEAAQHSAELLAWLDSSLGATGWVTDAVAEADATFQREIEPFRKKYAGQEWSLGNDARAQAVFAKNKVVTDYHNAVHQLRSVVAGDIARITADFRDQIARELANVEN